MRNWGWLLARITKEIGSARMSKTSFSVFFFSWNTNWKKPKLKLNFILKNPKINKSRLQLLLYQYVVKTYLWYLGANLSFRHPNKPKSHLFFSSNHTQSTSRHTIIFYFTTFSYFYFLNTFSIKLNNGIVFKEIEGGNWSVWQNQFCWLLFVSETS